MPQQPPQPVTPGEILAVVYGQGLGDSRFGLPGAPDAAAVEAALNLEPRLKAAIFSHVRRRAAVPPEPKPRRGAGLRVGALLLVLGGMLMGLSTLPLPKRLTWPDTAPLASMAAHSPTALFALRAEAELGNPAAAAAMAALEDSHWLPDETTLKKNDAGALKWYLLAAREGDAQSANNAGFDYQNGHGTAPDLFFAAQWYRAAADEGYAPAQTSLGYFYQNGAAVARSDATAAAWFTRAARQGDAAGENALGFLYYSGRGVAKDPAQALHWFAASAARKFAPAMLNVGLCYLQGAGVTADPIAAAEWFTLAGQYGDKQATSALAAVTPNLSPSQLAAAKTAAQIWESTHP